MNESITRFFQQQTCATLCCVDPHEKPWCFSCFYAFNEEEGLLYFKSSPDSQHAGLLRKNPHVAGTVLPDKLNKLVVKGIQFEGRILEASDPLCNHALANYLRKHPLAVAIPGEIWVVRISHIKMTDSTIGFGKKISWHREVPSFNNN